ncbi:hypothetical protein JW933_01260 [candidate division FCPU426 bacterium]|nr:hypothetical protein [candidate division FCPU426 bacterium]
MDYAAWYALAKGDYFLWFLILAVLAAGLAWPHYRRALCDLLSAPEEQADGEAEGK